jgi:alpha-galactosidase
MPNIVIIGAGSGFGTRLSLDILAHEALRHGRIALVDINQESARNVAEFVKAAVRQLGAPVEVVWSTDRRQVLEGANYVAVAIAVGGRAYEGSPFYEEVMIPAEYGIEQSVADTLGIGGVFRTLRTAPEMIRICHDMEELCPDALLLNYTNPMAMLCWAMNRASRIRTVGLCHSVQGTSHQLAHYIGKPIGEMRFWVAGINHMSWFLQLEWQGEDAYPLLYRAYDNPEIRKQDLVRFEIFRHFGCFVTESSTHMSEYVPYFRKNEALMQQLSLEHRHPSETATGGRHEWLERIRRELAESDTEVKLQSSGEYASYIIKALETDEPFRFNGNVPNRGVISNLPPQCCVEVPCLTDKTGMHPCHVGLLPSQLAALNLSNIAVHQLTVEACLEHDRRKAYYAVALDPLTAGQCALPQIRDMFDEMWAALQPWLVEY